MSLFTNVVNGCMIRNVAEKRAPRPAAVMDPPTKKNGRSGREFTTFLVHFDIKGARESIRLPASKECEFRNVLVKELIRKSLTLADIDIFIATATSPYPKDDKSLRVSTEPLGGIEIFIRNSPQAAKATRDEADPLSTLPGENPSVQEDPKLIKLQRKLKGYSANGIPDFPSLLSYEYDKNSRKEDPDTFFIEGTWKEVVDVDIQERMNRKEKEAQEGIWELLSTEANYIQKIRIIIDLYMGCLLNLQTEALLNEIETQKIFSNITTIESAHTVFWKDQLKAIVDKTRDSGKPVDGRDVAAAFNKFSERFTPYIKFCVEEASCLEYVSEMKKKNDDLRTLFEWCEQHPKCRMLQLPSLNDLLVSPMQKITKYHLMVERIYANSEDENTRHALKKTLHDITGFVSHVNHEIKKEEERKKMEKVAFNLEAYEIPNAPTGNEELSMLMKAHCTFDLRSPMPHTSLVHRRSLLLESSLKLTEKTGKCTVYAFLFTDALLLAKPSERPRNMVKNSSEKYRIIRAPMRVDKLEVAELKDQSGFVVLYVDDYNCGTYGFIAYPEGPTVREWMDKFAEAKDRYRHACGIDEVEYIHPDLTDTARLALTYTHSRPDTHGVTHPGCNEPFPDTSGSQCSVPDFDSRLEMSPLPVARTTPRPPQRIVSFDDDGHVEEQEEDAFHDPTLRGEETKRRSGTVLNAQDVTMTAVAVSKSPLVRTIVESKKNARETYSNRDDGRRNLKYNDKNSERNETHM